MKQLNLQQELAQILEHVQTLQVALEETQTAPRSFADYDFDQLARLARQFQYTNHPLARSDESTKQLYMTVLASVFAQMQHDLTTNLILFMRLHLASECEGSVLTLLKTATTLDEYIFDEFFPKLLTSPLRYNFIVDALVLSSCHGQPTVQVLHYIAELANLLGFEQVELEQVTTLSKLILLQDAKQFHHMFEQLNPLLDYFLYYTQTFVSGILVANERYFKFSAPKLLRFPIEQYNRPITSLVVEIDHASFDLTQFTKPLEFSDNSHVAIRDAAFYTKKTAYLPTFFQFSHITNLTWQNWHLEGIQVTTANQPFNLITCEAIEFFQIDTLVAQHNCFTIDLGELKTQNVLMQTAELMPFTGALVNAEAVTTAKMMNISATDTHTRLQYAVQNVLFGGTDFKERTITDGPSHSLFAGLEQAKTNQLHSHLSSQFFIK